MKHFTSEASAQKALKFIQDILRDELNLKDTNEKAKKLFLRPLASPIPLQLLFLNYNNGY